MSKRKNASSVRTRYWVDIVRAANSSGMNKSTWCELNGVNQNNFYYWQRKIRKMVLSGELKIPGEPVPGISETSVSDIKTDEPEFYEIAVHAPIVSEDSQEPVEIDVPNRSHITIRCGKYSIDVSDGFSKTMLKDIIGVMSDV